MSRASFCSARRTLRVAATFGLVGAMLAVSGCMARTVRTTVFEEGLSEIFLRQRIRAGVPVDRGFSHPVAIAPVRLSNLLARIEVRRKKSNEREPAIPTQLLYPIGEGISQALEKADSSQEVVVMAKERRRNMGVFTQDYLTSMIVWVDGDKIYLKLDRLEEVLSKNPKDKVPEPKLDQDESKYRAVGTDGIAAEGVQLVTANWRDPLFKDASVLRVRAGGQIIRRTVLMDSGVESTGGAAGDGGAVAIPPQGLSPDSLRALADLEEERRRGELSEADYQAKRRQILAGDDLKTAPPDPANEADEAEEASEPAADPARDATAPVAY